MSENLPRRDVTNVDELKALAHPLRQRLLYHLAFAGSGVTPGRSLKADLRDIAPTVLSLFDTTALLSQVCPESDC